jgi:hypothetical protein
VGQGGFDPPDRRPQALPLGESTLRADRELGHEPADLHGDSQHLRRAWLVTLMAEYDYAIAPAGAESGCLRVIISPKLSRTYPWRQPSPP